MKNIIFFGGIHGVGKNFILDNTKFSKPIIHLSASNLMKWNEISEKPEDKRVSSISSTQDLLITNLKKNVEDNKYYILDGHFTLLNNDDKIERIPEDTFFKINPKALIVKTANPISICERLKKRDNINWDINKIISMQIEELKYANELASKLGISFYEINDNQENILKSIIDSELQNG